MNKMLSCFSRSNKKKKWSPQKWEWDWGNASRFTIFPRFKYFKIQFWSVFGVFGHDFCSQHYLQTGIWFLIHSTTCKQAYSGARNSGFSDYACPQVRCTAEYMAGFRYILHLTLSIYLKGKAQQKIPSCRTLKGLKTVYSTDKGRTIIEGGRGGWTFRQRKRQFFWCCCRCKQFFCACSEQFVFVHRLIAVDFILNWYI
jgi:hypothetical protein